MQMSNFEEKLGKSFTLIGFIHTNVVFHTIMLLAYLSSTLWYLENTLHAVEEQ